MQAEIVSNTEENFLRKLVKMECRSVLMFRNINWKHIILLFIIFSSYPREHNIHVSLISRNPVTFFPKWCKYVEHYLITFLSYMAIWLHTLILYYFNSHGYCYNFCVQYSFGFISQFHFHFSLFFFFALVVAEWHFLGLFVFYVFLVIYLIFLWILFGH